MISATAPRTSPVRPVDRRPPQDASSIGDCVEKIARKVAGVAVGFVFGTSGLVANAGAGAAAGAVHAARVKSHPKAAFYGLMTANLAAAGALGGPVGAAMSLAGGFALWGIQGGEVRAKVTACSDAWVDQVLSKLPGDPEQAGVPRRVLNGAIGEVVGAGAGVVAGTLGLYHAGESVGEAMVTRIAERLRS